MPPASHSSRRRPPRRRYPFWRLIRANFYDFGLLLRDSWVALVSFALLALAGTLYLHYGHPARLGFAAALFETLKLVSLQTGLELPNDLLGEALFFLIPLLGLALIFQSVLNFGRLLLDKGSRREAWQVALAATYRDHVIVCGLGRVGMRVADQLLSSGYAPVVIERDWRSAFVARALSLKVPVVMGDAREPEVLRQAGIERAYSVAALTSDDLMNLQIGLAARRLRADAHVVLRAFSDALADKLADMFGIRTAYSTSGLASATLAAAAVLGDIAYAFAADEALFSADQISVRAGDALDGRTAGELRDQHDALVIELRRDGQAHSLPALDLALAPGDTITLLADIDALERLRALLRRH